ncbi:putative Xaa-Pro aminopeptidase [Acetonema longum DSM 6540]|uniref:Putative Xaa-Pro aminopeptidase n=2 Tax=Acetonema TaxID=2373 RepID=F7NFD4_9FIRM|nr:putative Xaa-Pro aminopeptidase [Acetonema longum DSM 6540]
MNKEAGPFINARIEKLRLAMGEKNIDTAIIARPENVFYFSNFNPIINSHPAYVIISLKQDACLLVHCIRNDHARMEGSVENVQLYGKWGANVALAMHDIDAIAALLGDSPIRLGVEGDYASVNWLKAVHSKLNAADTSDIAGDIEMLKIIKDAYEIGCIRKSAALVDCGVETAIGCLDAGAHEAAACTEGQYRMREMWHERFQDYEVSGFGSSEGAQVDSLAVWSMANERIAYGCDCPQAYFPVAGDLVLPMSWARIGGYAAENERSVAVGELDALRNRAYDAMLGAREALFAVLRPGTPFEELYLAAMKVFEDAGFSSILPGRCGHGIGLSTHEFPSLTSGNKIRLKPGMVFTVEPGLMTKDWGGVRHSDTVLVTEAGYELLTQSRRDKITIKQCAYR